MDDRNHDEIVSEQNEKLRIQDFFLQAVKSVT